MPPHLRLAAVLFVLFAPAMLTRAQPVASPAAPADTLTGLGPRTESGASARAPRVAADSADVPASLVLRPAAPSEEAWAAAPPCRYEACALRLDTGLALRIVRGREEATALRIGFSTPRLADLVADAPEAVPHAREFERTHTPLQVVSAGGLGLSVLSVLPGVSTGTRTMAMLGGVLLTLASRPLLAQNRRALERAIWEYNATLAR